MDAYFRRIYAETKNDIYAYLRAKTPTSEDAADLMQETYMAFVKNLKKHGVGSVKDPPAFLTDLAAKKVSDFYRKRRIPPASLDEQLDDDLPLGAAIPANISVEEAVLTAQTVSEVRAALRGKDEVTRKIFDLHYLGDLTLEEIAALLGVKVSFVKNRLYRTLHELRKLYGKEQLS